MQQPELGQQLLTLRKQKNLTQEELVEKSHVSVRTIQRIEAGEVIPRLSTIKILWHALGEDYKPETKSVPDMSTNTFENTRQQQHLLMAVIAGALYLAFEITLTAMDFSMFNDSHPLRPTTQIAYIALTAGMAFCYALFAYGFVLLGRLFENKLLPVAAVLMAVVVAATGVLDVSMLGTQRWEQLTVAYAIAAVVVGVCSLVFGIALLQLQDGMGGLAKVAGVLEMVLGCALITVVLFLVAFVAMIPATVVEILLLYRGYEYLGKSRTVSPAAT